MKIAICDDKLEEREKYAKILSLIAKKQGCNVNFDFFECGDQLLFEYEDPKMQADILLLDINMPGTDGAKTAQILRHLGYRNLIIFITVAQSTELYCNAFDVKAYHYIVKNEFSQPKVEEIFADALLSAKNDQQKFFLFECGGDSRNIEINTIKYFDVMHRIVTVHYGKNDTFQFYSPLDKVADTMEAYGFVRIHRSYIVALDQIETFSGDKLKLFDGTELPVSRKAYSEIKIRMEKKSRR